MLAAVVTYAVYTAVLRERPAVHGLSFVSATFAIGAALLLPFYIAEGLWSRPLPLTEVSVLAIGYVAVFASILSYLAYNRTVELVGANTAGLTAHLVPVFGTLLAWVFLGERLHAYHAAGIALIGWLAGYLLSTRVLFPAPPPPGDLHEVPDVRGMDLAAAREALAESELIGLAPLAAFLAVADHAGADPSDPIETRLAAAASYLKLRDHTPMQALELRLEAAQAERANASP